MWSSVLPTSIRHDHVAARAILADRPDKLITSRAMWRVELPFRHRIPLVSSVIRCGDTITMCGRATRRSDYSLTVTFLGKSGHQKPVQGDPLWPRSTVRQSVRST
jgi:hypothetical protein